MRLRAFASAFFALWFPALIAWPAPAQSEQAGGGIALVGDWQGSSVCLVKPSACRDEDSLYHIAAVPRREGWFTLNADRITDGKIVNMGTVDCSYAPADRLLQCDLPRGTIRLVLDGNQLRGTMTLPDNTVWRKITLKRLANS